MLRPLVGVLLLGNLAFYAWTQGWLDDALAAAGVHNAAPHEPERLGKQVTPPWLQIVPPGGEASPAAAAVEPPAHGCLVAGPFTEAELATATAALDAAAGAALSPADAAKLRTLSQGATSDVPGVWAVYMGKYAAPDLLAKKEAELRRISIPFETLTAPPDLAPGLVLSRHPSEVEAALGLAKVAAHGVHSARVVVLQPAGVEHRLRVEPLDDALLTRVQGLDLAFPSQRRLEACPAPAAEAAASAGDAPASAPPAASSSTAGSGVSAAMPATSRVASAPRGAP